MFLSLPVLTVIIIFCSLVVAWLIYKRTATKDLIKKTKEEAIMGQQLTNINEGVISIQVDIRAHNSKFDSMTQQLTRCEESCKSAHKRLDDIEYIKRKEVL